MSFGLRDEDWVDPDPEVFVRCRDCERYTPCPCGCEWGICDADGEATYMRRYDGCWQQPRWRG